MLEGSENKRRSNCWMERTELEKGLLGLLVVTTILISILAVVLLLHTMSSTDGCEEPSSTRGHLSFFKNNSDSTSEPCNSPACVKSASEILSRIDTNIDPCENFYQFACNNKPINTKSDFHPPFTEIVNRELSRIEEIYTEPIMEDDHPLVTVQKIMYDACMNETAIAEDASTTLKEILKIVGGWPVLEQQWNPAKFDWVQTTYKLRQLGYIHNSFLELKIVPDTDDTDKYIFQVSIPKVQHIYSKWFDSDENSGFMTDVAIALGAEIHRALGEMTETYQFLNDLQWQRNSIMDEKVPFHRATVAEFQKREDAINWIEFINTIAGPDITVSKNDVVLFPPERALDEWFGLLKRTPKRTLANYMLWQVVEENLPYLTDQLLNARVRPRLMKNSRCETRSEFCIDEINKRFSPSPINILYLRKYLPEKKREAVEELANNMKSALLDVVKEAEWMDVLDRENVIQDVENLSIIVGAPGNYFDDTIFDMKFDMDISTNNFLKLLAQASRNNYDRLYGLIEKSPQDTEIYWSGVTLGGLMFPKNEGNERKNEILLGASIVQDTIFNEDQPNYLNYANLGILTKYYLLQLFERVESNQSISAIKNIEMCLMLSTLPENASVTDYLPVYELLAHKLAIKISREAYKKWAKDTEEPPLAAIDYKPEQLFWMSSGYLFCQYTDYPTFTFDELSPESKTIYDSTVAKVINSNPDLARDFRCSEIPEEICKLF